MPIRFSMAEDNVVILPTNHIGGDFTTESIPLSQKETNRIAQDGSPSTSSPRAPWCAQPGHIPSGTLNYIANNPLVASENRLE